MNKRDRLTPRKTRTLICFLWTGALFVTLLPLSNWGRYEYHDGWMQCILTSYNKLSLSYVFIYALIVFIVPVTLMTYTYTCIIRVVRRNALRIHVHIQRTSITTIKTNGIHGKRSSNRQNINMRFKTKAFKTILILFFMFVVSWMPYTIILIMWNLSETVHNHYVIGNIILCITYMNCVTNPVVYCWRIKKFREACKNYLVPYSLLRYMPCQSSSSAQRRINPSTMYECSEFSSVTP